MSLLQNMSYQEFEYASSLPKSQCELIAKLADVELVFNVTKKPGEVLLKYLDRRGYSIVQYKQFLKVATISTFYKPQSKVALLIANDKYEHLSKLATPTVDCETLQSKLTSLGFITVYINNVSAEDLKKQISKVLQQIPEDSYCFIFYAGHGCEICNTKCILGIDCPTDSILPIHCITENWLLQEVSKCKPELCVLIMDMCRNILNREENKELYNSILNIEDCIIHSNLLIAYSTQSSKSSYEVLQIECSHTIDMDETYELKTGDLEKIIPSSSQYVNALCSRIFDNVDVSALLDKVHEDLENCRKKQRPIKVQCGVAKRSLYDPVKGDTAVLLAKLRCLVEQFPKQCSVL
ncbi:uncharacterized protein LOC126976310 isoform X1 [Leptidea sinapis]|uniref:uncharacterized protein LOC126976310 isoform X1 n=1 Tax=Leptidea sinapis TaxID=189913 RepID=UPI0021C3C5A1|nr:uncharacterized protein LOC126976310 isoform X1 [Leptidea sinapis]